VSCEKQNEEFLNISFTPREQYEIRNSGEIIHFSIKLSSNSELSELIIVEEVKSIIDTMYHEQISGLEKTELYNYTCPNISSSDTSKVTLKFYCSNTNGDFTERAKVFSVVSENVYLSETTGHTMYSSNSDKFNAYNLLDGLSMYSTDSTSHISDNTDSLSDILSRTWVSLSGLSFTKHNNFDYANATIQTLENAYESSLKKEYVDNIVSDDIILTKIMNKYIAIRVFSVVDDVGSEDDRYIFSIKQ